MDQNTVEQVQEINALVTELKEASQKQYAEIEEKGAAHGKTLEEVANRLQEVERKGAILEKKAARRKAIVEENASIEKEMKSVNDHLHVLGRKDSTFEDVAKFVEIKSVLEKAIRKGDRSLSPEEYKSINGVIDPDGGYLVAPQYSTALGKKVFDNRQIAAAITSTTIGSDTWKEYVDFADYSDSVYESQIDATGSDQGNNDFKEVVISVGEQYFPKKFSRSVLEDSFVNLDTEVMGSVQSGMMRKDADGILNGLGTTESPLRGILTYDNGTDWGQIQRVPSATSAAFDWDDVLEGLPSVLNDDFHGNAKYGMRRASFYSLLTAKDSQGKYQIGNQINFFDDNLSLRLLGYEVLFDAGMPSVASGNLAVAFGDFAEAYRKVNRIGFSVHRNDSDAKFITLTGRNRTGGDVKQFQAVKLLEISA